MTRSTFSLVSYLTLYQSSWSYSTDWSIDRASLLGHALSGVVGTLLTGIFAQASVANNDAYAAIPGGWLDGNFRQLGLQVAWVMVGLVWTFVVTLAIMFVIDHIPGLHFRSTDEAEIVGMDEVEHGEYANDYVSLRRDLESSFSPQDPQRAESLHRIRSAHSQREKDDEEKGRGRERYYSKERTIVEVASGSDEERAHGNGDRGGLSVQGNGSAGQGKEELRLRSRSRGRGFGAGGGGLGKVRVISWICVA